jgi:SAM-dependent methyltransferase
VRSGKGDVAMPVVPSFIDPVTRAPLNYSPQGQLVGDFKGRKISYVPQDGVFDLVTDPATRSEREHYDSFYSKKKKYKISIGACRGIWNDRRAPEHKFLLQSLGPLADKTVLLLGNGGSLKELLFLEQGAKVVCTDLSLQSMQYMRTVFQNSEFYSRGLGAIDFYAVDALALPFPSEFFDLVYGYVFVHHIQDLRKLFSELSRCLKPGGTCRFFDNAYSPVWHFAKTRLLRPFQMFAHLRAGISPEDKIASEKGGFKEDELIALMRECGFHSLLFKRLSFFQYLALQSSEKLIANIGSLRTFLSYVFAPLDDFCAARTSFIERNGVSLVWGFTKHH